MPSERRVSNGEPLSTSKRLPEFCDLCPDVEDAPVSAYLRKIEHPPTRVLSGNITEISPDIYQGAHIVKTKPKRYKSDGNAPNTSTDSKGIHQQGGAPNTSTDSKGIHQQGEAPNMSTDGKGIHQQEGAPNMSTDSKGIQSNLETRLPGRHSFPVNSPQCHGLPCLHHILGCRKKTTNSNLKLLLPASLPVQEGE